MSAKLANKATTAAHLPLTLDVIAAAKMLGIGRSLAYDLVKRDQFPVRVLRIGHKLRIPTADLLTYLGQRPGEAA